MPDLLQQPIRLATRWHSNELLDQTLAWVLLENSQEIARWNARPERLLTLHSGLLENLGEGLVFEDKEGTNYQKLSGLRFARLVLRKNSPDQYDAERNGWHVHAFYPLPYLPLAWPGDRSFSYLMRHIAGYFVSGIESDGDGWLALTTDLELTANIAPAQLLHLNEMLEPLIQQMWPVEVAATFWQEQLNRPLRYEFDAPDLLQEWALKIIRNDYKQ